MTHIPDQLQLCLADGKARVFDVTDALRLRSQHGVCGILSGTLPQVAQQNVFLGLPLTLLPEEVFLLSHEAVIRLVDDALAHQPVSAAQADTLAAHRDILLKQERLEASNAHLETQQALKAKFGDEIRRVRAEKRRCRVTGPEGGDSGRETSPEEQVASSRDHPAFSEANHVISIDGKSTGPWYRPDMAIVDFKEPPTLHDRTRQLVFKDLRQRGFMMGGALRFGGDFLLYPGDPLRFHSHFTATIFLDTTSPVSMLAIVASGRLATAVKKAHLLCAVDTTTGKAEYVTLEWAAM